MLPDRVPVDVVNETDHRGFGLPCGTLYETVYDLREGIRWYLDGKLVRRFVSQNAEGTWSLSPTGDGPTVTMRSMPTGGTSTPFRGDESSGPGGLTRKRVQRLGLPASA